MGSFNEYFSIEFLFVSGLISICISLIISYIISGKDESILTNNYWDPVDTTDSSNI